MSKVIGEVSSPTIAGYVCTLWTCPCGEDNVSDGNRIGTQVECLICQEKFMCVANEKQGQEQ